MFTKKISYTGGLVGHQRELPNYFIDFIKGNDTLFITFEFSGKSLSRPDGGRSPWGLNFLVQKRGFSLLGVKPKYIEWYRKNDLHQFFRSTEFAKFISRFKKVVLYGGSMGGYAALAFAEAVPGCTVIALNPQSTLNRKLVPWEKRFKDGWNVDWQGDFNDAAFGATFAENVYVVYDPLLKFDKKHIERLDSNNLICLKVPLVGHRMPVWLAQMGVLGKIVDLAVANNLTEQDFYTMARERRNIPHYFVQMAKRAKNKQLKRDCVNRALYLNPTDIEALTLHCKCLLEESKFVEALVIAENILKTKGTGIELAYQAYRRLGGPDKIHNFLVGLASDDQKVSLQYLINAINFALSLKEIEMARKLLEKAIERSPNNHKINILAETVRDAKYQDRIKITR